MKKFMYVGISILLFSLLSACNDKQASGSIQNKEYNNSNIEVQNEDKTNITTVSNTKNTINKENANSKQIITFNSNSSDKQNEQQEKQLDFSKQIKHLQTLDFEKIAKEAYTRSKKLEKEDRDIRKWMIRIHIYYAIAGNEISDEQLKKEAKHVLERRTAWYKYVKKEYKVTATDKEVDDYIKSVVKNTDASQKIAKGLGMSVDYMNYKYDRDQYEMQVLWKKLLPLLEKKYPPKKDESITDYNNRLNEEFNKELDEYMKKL